MNEWELLKENVEPIKSGRSIKTLKSALNQKPNELTARELKRKEFESELRTYSGSDLLSVYYEYILWVEQNYPLGGNEANLQTLLENCIQQFYSTDLYNNDERLLEVFLKFIKKVDNPLEVFSFFHENGFATKLSQFYINWSFHLENQKNCRKAVEVLRTAMSSNAQPIASLKRALEELEVRVAKAIINDKIEDINEEADEEQQRKPLIGLKSKTKKGKTVAPIIRVGAALKNSREGLKTNTTNAVPNKAPEIYCDENDPEVRPKTSVRPETTNAVKAIASVGQENTQKAGKWSENKLTQKKRVVSESQPKFLIHESDDESPEPEPVKKPVESNALKQRSKNSGSPPIARFEKPDPLKRYAFIMNKIYAGSEEFSFEEIRAKKWMAKKKREEETLRNKHLEEEVAQLRAQVELLLKSQQTIQSNTQSVDKQNVENREVRQQKQEIGSPPPSSADSSAAKSTTNSDGNPNQTTRGANSLIRELWNGTLGNQTLQQNQGLDINAVIDRNEEQIHKMDKKFDIFSDTTIMSKVCDKKSKSRESTGSIDYTIALPRSEQTFVANTGCSSTPVANKSVRNGDYFNGVQPNQNNCNFVGGLTAKLNLSPIVETSREYNSKSSSSSSGTMSTTGGSALSRRQRALSGVENVDPFDIGITVQIINSLAEAIDSRKGFFRVKKCLPKIKKGETLIRIGSDSYKIDKLIATGAYAHVYSAQIDASDSLNEESTGFTKLIDGSQKWFALKVSKQSTEWEFYICDELSKRLNRSKALPDIELSVMTASPTLMFKDGYVLVDELAPNGTLMDVVNVCKKSNNPFPKALTVYFTLELIQIVGQIHRQYIIHADIKPDNILVLNFPSREDIANVLKRTSSLKLIDFGRSIDMSQFPEGTTFNVLVTTKGSQCPEMLDSKPWSYQTDWFGVLDCIHVMLFGDYIKIEKKDNKWQIKEKFRRYHFTELYKPLFETLLNIQDSNQMPDLTPFIHKMNAFIKQNINQIIRESNDIEIYNAMIGP